jgi:hypothetical protein
VLSRSGTVARARIPSRLGAVPRSVLRACAAVAGSVARPKVLAVPGPLSLTIRKAAAHRISAHVANAIVICIVYLVLAAAAAIAVLALCRSDWCGSYCKC